MGSLGDNYAGNTIHQLKDAVYTVALGVPPELIGWALSIPRLLDSVLDPLIGYWSDQSSSRWGRRRPFIFGGALALGTTMILLWHPPAQAGWSHHALAGYFLVVSMLYYAAYSLFLVPYRALGLELTQDYHDRTRLQAWGMMVGLIGGLGIPWLYKLSLLIGGSTAEMVAPGAILAGARWVGIGVGVLILITCVVPAVFCREPPRTASPPRTSLRLALRATLGNRPFLHMLGMNGFAVIGLYAPVTVVLLVNIYDLFAGDQHAAATLTGYLGMVMLLGCLAGVPVNTALSGRIGKRGTALIALALAATGCASLWWTLLPAHPYGALASQFLIGWGSQGIWLMSATMNADVCDRDELATGQRRQGLYGAVFALEQKVAFACAALLGGYLVARCGYVAGATPDATTLHHLRVTLVITPTVCLALAALAIMSYPLTRARVEDIQRQLATRPPA
jgi:glycoside/pentoside/hexuronide:cation symporter, GPH family